MNYIEQMMQMAEVEPEPIYSEVWADEQMGVYFPDFTAEKQLEIIKLISSKNYLSTIQYEDGSRGFTVEYYKTDKNNTLIWHVVEPTFAQALAKLTTKLMKADDLDKEKVKEILENG